MPTTYTSTVRHTGLSFGEAPRWHDGRLWYSDFYRHGVFSLGDDGERLELTVEHQPSGLGWQPDGTLLVVSMTDHLILAVGADGAVREHADISAYCGYWANDMTVASDGTAYVGNFGFDLDSWVEGLASRAEGDPIPPTATTSVVVLAPDGSFLQAVDEHHFPNGMVLSDDGATFVVGETLAQRLTAFDVAGDGTLSNRRLFAELPCPPDGICLDQEGQVWVANPVAAQCLRVAEGGEVTATVTTQRNCFACMLGGEDRRTLHLMTATASDAKTAAAVRDAQVEIVVVDVPGAGLP